MRDYKHLTRFPAKDKALLKLGRQVTGLTINELIVRSTQERLTHIINERKNLVLTAIPDSAVASAYRNMSEAELAEDKTLGRASIRAQKGQG